jgi:hypothetical protein
MDFQSKQIDLQEDHLVISCVRYNFAIRIMNSLITDLRKYNIAAVIPCYRVEYEIISTIENLPARRLKHGMALHFAAATASLATSQMVSRNKQ